MVDLHLIDNDLGISAYPLVPGHEAIGTITAVGERAENLAIGQQVGVGWQRGACNRCEWCLRGLQNGQGTVAIQLNFVRPISPLQQLGAASVR